MRLTFDRGTIVLHSSSRSEHVANLPGMLWDPRILRYRAPAYRYREIALALRRRGAAFVDDVRSQSAATGPWQAIELRPYQHAALLAWSAERQGLIVLPTGAGKTRVACAAMAECRAPTLCLVPTRALLHQWRAELSRHYGGPIGCLGDGEHRIEDITLATFESGYRQMDRLGHRFGLLIVDEVHHFGTGIRDEALEMCAAPRRLALTATAPDGAALERVCELMGPLVCELAIADLAGTWLAEFDSIVLRLRLTGDEQQRYDAAVASFRVVFDRFRAFGKGMQWSDFVAVAARSEPGRAALAAFQCSRQLTSYPAAKRTALASLLHEHRGSRVLVFTSDNETAYAIAREHLIMPITCDIDRREREQALAAFRAGELGALVSAQVLNEGIDVPDAEVAIVVGGKRGEREHVQRVGRLLRPAPGKRALVYELVVMATHEVRKAAHRRRALAPGSHRDV
jgi:superfamily II DNA or RNA helicase